jgi:hypothetical protein
MSPLDNQHPERLSAQTNQSKDLDSQITGKRQQIAALQRELAELEQRQRDIERRQALVTPIALPGPAGGQSRQVPWRLLIVAVLSLVLVYGGQFILLRTNAGMPDERMRQAWAGGMLIAGALLFGAFMPWASGLLPRLEFPGREAHPTSLVWRSRWGLGWLSAAVVLAAIDILLFITLKENLIVVLLWLVSILVLGIAQVQHIHLKRPLIRSGEWKYLAGLVMLLLIALITRVYHLTTLPYNVDGDFASVGLQARELVTGRQQHIFAYGWAAIPMLGYLPSWLSMSLFGNNLAGLNASGVIEGLLIILGAYLLGRDLFHPRVGLTAAAFMTISYAHLAASRQSVYLDPVLFLEFGIYFLFVGLREGQGLPIVVSGLLTAFCALVYYPSRIIVFIVGAMLLYLLLFRRRWLWARGWAIVLWVLAVLITLGPMIVVFAQGFDAFMSRTREVFILSPDIVRHMQGVYHVETVPDMLLEQARRSVLIFHYYTDTGTQFGFRRPLLDPFTAPLFTLGMGYALFHLRRFGSALALVWTILSVIVGCFLTGNPPFWARLMILLPPTMLLAALALNVIYELAHRSLERIGSWATLIAPAATVLCLIAVGVLNWNTYVELKGTFATARTLIARYLEDQPPSARAYLVSQGFTYKDREFDFLVPGRLVAGMTPEQAEADIPPVGKPTLLVVTPEYGALIEQLQQHFPNGSSETHLGNSPNEIAFYVFRLP